MPDDDTGANDEGNDNDREEDDSDDDNDGGDGLSHDDNKLLVRT